MRQLGANEYVRMMFVIDMPVTKLPLLTKVQMAARSLLTGSKTDKIRRYDNGNRHLPD
jgi:hypothetical protein